MFLDCDLVSIGDVLSDALKYGNTELVATFFQILDDQKKKLNKYDKEKADAWLEEIRKETKVFLEDKKIEEGKSREHQI